MLEVYAKHCLFTQALEMPDQIQYRLLPTGREERGVLEDESISVAYTLLVII